MPDGNITAKLAFRWYNRCPWARIQANIPERLVVREERDEIRDWLAEKLYTPTEVDKILRKLDQHDARMNRKSLFDDLANGRFDLSSIIKEALEFDEGQP
jgi:hypothetical protein